ncbi:MAG: EutN/CcmL family microcompartment protein [Verrucomicrobia bacterium]|jgi:microcompartment protein CcmK/EutM|nr:EutN/CcmL family microcompartment protein [Verrucomicrobiota bacterium]MBO7391675.1 EutN/CcmL family microcompartment protein [Verrucomicrobiota bacterium]
MLLARVVGNVVATQKHKSLAGQRLILCQPEDLDGKPAGAPLVAIDPLGAGMHQRVNLSSDGLTARNIVNDPRSPARYIIIGIVDEVTA